MLASHGLFEALVTSIHPGDALGAVGIGIALLKEDGNELALGSGRGFGTFKLFFTKFGKSGHGNEECQNGKKERGFHNG